MEQLQQDNITAQDTESPATKPKHAGGRKPKGYYERGIQDKLSHSASKAADILDDHIEQRKGRRNLKISLQRACEYVIDHAIGKSRQKIEHSGGILTYADLAKGASALDSKPRPILADVLEIANKYDKEHPEPGDTAGSEVKPDGDASSS